jgi:hypothetical protein
MATYAGTFTLRCQAFWRIGCASDAVIQTVYPKNKKIGRAEFSEVFAPLFSTPRSNEVLRVDLRGHYSNSLEDLQALLRDCEPLGGMAGR